MISTSAFLTALSLNADRNCAQNSGPNRRDASSASALTVFQIANHNDSRNINVYSSFPRKRKPRSSKGLNGSLAPAFARATITNSD